MRRGFLVLLMYDSPRRGTLHVWRHESNWKFRFLGPARIGVGEHQDFKLTLLRAKFRPVEDRSTPEEAIAREDYLRFLDSFPENRIQISIAQGDFIFAGVPRATGMERRDSTIWACGVCEEALWHFETEREFKYALRGGFLRLLGMPQHHVESITDEILRLFKVAESVEEGRSKFHRKLELEVYGRVVRTPRWHEKQTAIVKGKTCRLGEEDVGLCSASDPNDRFRFIGNVEVASLPAVEQERIISAGYVKDDGCPVFENLTTPGFRFFKPV